MPQSRVHRIMNTPDVGRYLTQREFNALLQHAKLEDIAVLLFGVKA